MAPVEYSKKMGGATFIGKDLGWVPFQDSTVPPQYPPTESWNKSETTLFLGIASLRDTLCPHTLFNAYSKAMYPKRLSIGVVQQNAPGDIDCFDEYCNLMLTSMGRTYSGKPSDCPYSENIRMLRVPSTQAKGPTWGRAKAAGLLRDEEFCMQTDAHMDFVPYWDVHLMGMWASTGNEYAVLSTYVADSTQLQFNLDGKAGLNGLHEVPHLCMVTLDGAHGLVRVWGTKCARNLPKPKLTNAVWGAGLSFSKCHAERKAVYDPHTPFIFDGEEFSRAVRFWTWGYDIYTPNRVFVVHNYKQSQSDRNHFDWYRSVPDPKEGTVEQSVFRLKTLFEIAGGEPRPADRLRLHQSKYGLGDRRTFDQVIQFSGIDTRGHRILANRCGNLDLVPFTEHPFGAEYIPRYDNVTEEFVDVRDPGSIYYDKSSQGMVQQWGATVAARRRVAVLHNGQLRKAISSLSSSSSSGSGGSTIVNNIVSSVVSSSSSSSAAKAGGTLTSAEIESSRQFVSFIGAACGAAFIFIVLAVYNRFCRHRFHRGKQSRIADELPDPSYNVATKTV